MRAFQSELTTQFNYVIHLARRRKKRQLSISSGRRCRGGGATTAATNQLCAIDWLNNIEFIKTQRHYTKPSSALSNSPIRSDEHIPHMARTTQTDEWSAPLCMPLAPYMSVWPIEYISLCGASRELNGVKRKSIGASLIDSPLAQ